MTSRTRRRVLIAAGALIAVPIAAWAQQAARTPVVGYLALDNADEAYGYFRDEMKRLGYVEGRNVEYVFRTAGGVVNNLPGLADELVRRKADVIVTYLFPAMLAAAKASKEIPIVLSGAADPVGTGLVESLARPGGNVTGTSSATAEVAGKSLEAFLGVVPKAKRGAVLANAADLFTSVYMAHVLRAASALSLEVSPVMVRDAGEFDAAVAGMVKRRAEFVIVQPSLQRRTAAQVALKHRLPAIATSGTFADDGGLMSYAANFEEAHRGAALYVDRILKGAKPADLPVQQPTKFDLAINLRTARARGLTVPKAMLARADRVIE
jgi:putative tryptophan/tyrosine transport system substrate-binding protein